MPVLVTAVPVFAAPATVPVFPWKATPTVGHVKGIVRDEQGAVLDTVAVALLSPRSISEMLERLTPLRSASTASAS